MSDLKERPSEGVLKYIRRLEHQNNELLARVKKAEALKELHENKVLELGSRVYYLQGRILPLNYRIKYLKIVLNQLVEGWKKYCNPQADNQIDIAREIDAIITDWTEDNKESII